MRQFIFFLLLAVLASTAWGQTYKWRDASGRIQYSDTPPPPGAKDVQQLRKAPAPPASATPPASKSITDRDAEFRKRLVEKKEAEAKQAKAADDEQTRARNCTQATGQLAALESGGRMVQLNAQGERIALDDAGRERAKQEAQHAIESWCK
ncbi:MAG: DUF4124 domain-containing protein [Betaproteobacteria bacterium]|nr:DUF4124 domain-containing protein [Betaproteobacteria bacterium]